MQLDDLIRANVGNAQFAIRLILKSVIFPNQVILRRGWYTANVSINHLVFDNCSIQRIGAFAFHQKQFFQLTSLHLQNMVDIECDSDMLNELKNFGGIYLFNVTIRQFDGSILVPPQYTLTEMECQATNHFTSFNDLFGTRRRVRLKKIFYTSVANLTVLAFSNFSGLPHIQHLKLTNCGVEVILENAFDYILMTLTNLDLTYNHLKTYSGHIFNCLNEYNTVMRSVSMIRLTGNTLECNCAVYEAASLLMLSFREYLIEYSKILYVCEDQFLVTANATHTITELQCEHVQDLRADKMCLGWENSRMYKIGHTRFSVKFDCKTDELIVRSPPKVTKYRIWIQLNGSRLMLDENMSDCPTGLWMSTSLDCKWHRSGPLTRVPIGRYLQSAEPIVICLSYLLSRGVITFWPFNCLAVMKRPEIDPFHSRTFLSTDRMIVYGLCGFLLGLIASFAYKLYLCQRNTLTAEKR